MSEAVAMRCRRLLLPAIRLALDSWIHLLLFYHLFCSCCYVRYQTVGCLTVLASQGLAPVSGAPPRNGRTLFGLHIREVLPSRWSGVWYVPLCSCAVSAGHVVRPVAEVRSASVTKLWVA